MYCNRLKDSIQETNNRLVREVSSFHHRIDSLMTAEQIKEHIEFILEREFGVIRHEFKSDFFTLKYLVQGVIDMFNIPGLIGEAAPHKTITDYIIESHKMNTKNFEDITTKISEIETK
jgi:hypothetical protein